jgi:hypothetical protein
MSDCIVRSRSLRDFIELILRKKKPTKNLVSTVQKYFGTIHFVGPSKKEKSCAKSGLNQPENIYSNKNIGHKAMPWARLSRIYAPCVLANKQT